VGYADIVPLCLEQHAQQRRGVRIVVDDEHPLRVATRR
jgi:hypothetical protein